MAVWAGSALQCYECVGTCKNMNKTTCPEGTKRCYSVYINQDIYDYMVKECDTHDSCDGDYSSPDQEPVKPYCCETDLCNSAFNNVMSLGTAVLLPLVSLYLSQF
ncbi:PREDICTED: lymphocyte antigen 6G-like [Nanorana parkeri]|uniref:lymphocyte antigen 6G-like n=1 Tax=Nanorana parkeri TaxID=125878 RepID=UPI0008548F49|nr:PREDICTED: lymphocyte antigen 6G-like [Nanorana parkeri]